MAFRVAFGLFWRQCPGLWQLDFGTALVAAASFCPFILETVVGGQCSALALLCVALSMELERRQRPISAGAALALCLYKPTLLLIIIPMLVLTSRWRMLLGGALMTSALGVLSGWTVGTQGLVDYRQLLAHYAAVRRDAPETFDHWKYVDFAIFVQRIIPHPPAALWWVLAGLGCAAAGVMARLAWQAGRERTTASTAEADTAGVPGLQLAWAAALACTPILSPHCAIYDTIFVIPAVMLTANFLALRRVPSTGGHGADATMWLTRPFAALVVLLYLTPWFTQPLAKICHIQMLTLVLAALGIYIACLAQRYLSTARLV